MCICRSAPGERLNPPPQMFIRGGGGAGLGGLLGFGWVGASKPQNPPAPYKHSLDNTCCTQSVMLEPVRLTENLWDTLESEFKKKGKKELIVRLNPRTAVWHFWHTHTHTHIHTGGHNVLFAQRLCQQACALRIGHDNLTDHVPAFNHLLLWVPSSLLAAAASSVASFLQVPLLARHSCL